MEFKVGDIVGVTYGVMAGGSGKVVSIKKWHDGSRSVKVDFGDFIRPKDAENLVLLKRYVYVDVDEVV